jgi:hypothetical protein
MKRKALLRDGDEFIVLEEGEFTAETSLQEALKRNPETIPTVDLELDQVVVVGRETGLPAGSVDLLLVDAEGRVLLVETKLSMNPELRRQVVAQLLDYGASLWRTAPSLPRFENLVLRYWRSSACEDARVKQAASLREGIEPIFRELCGEEWEYEAFEASLEDNLANGRHVMLIVASGLVDGLSRDLLQYANVCLNLPLYGVEIDVFQTGAKQLIVPRGVRYTASRPSRPSPGHTDRTAFLAACTPVAARFFQTLIGETERRGMILYWGTSGFSVRMPVQPPITVMRGFCVDEFKIYTEKWPLDDAGRKAFVERAHRIAPVGGSGKYTLALHITEKTEAQAYEALAFVWDEVDQMMAAADQPWAKEEA